MMKTDIKSLNYQELQEQIIQMGEKPFRGKQLYQWLHRHLANSTKEMSNLSQSFRETLDRKCIIQNTHIARQQTSADGTTKFLLELTDGNYVESVLMKYKHGNSVCISTQAGCRMGCRFCASTIGGLVRNLTVSEMLEQVYQIQRLTGERVSNVILMGIGEPLDNYDNVVKFIRMLSDEHGLNISQRNITLSTCGLVEQIRRLSGEQLVITLAISLHAPNDAIRRELMPVAERYSIKEILTACKDYLKDTRRRITFEYSLVDGKNDAPEQAEELARQLKGILCHVNLIPLNPVEGRLGKRSRTEQIAAFKKVLEKNKINVTVRREMGRDIDAACGQLRNKAQ